MCRAGAAGNTYSGSPERGAGSALAETEGFRLGPQAKPRRRRNTGLGETPGWYSAFSGGFSERKARTPPACGHLPFQGRQILRFWRTRSRWRCWCISYRLKGSPERGAGSALAETEGFRLGPQAKPRRRRNTGLGETPGWYSAFSGGFSERKARTPPACGHLPFQGRQNLPPAALRGRGYPFYTLLSSQWSISSRPASVRGKSLVSSMVLFS